MKIVKFLGGLGNQMFQYSFYLALKKHDNKVLADLTAFENYNLHNGFELEEIFNIKLNASSSFENKLYDATNRKWIWRKLRRLTNSKKVYRKENNEFTFDKSIFQDKSNRYYWGYWQHIDYVNMSSKQLKNDFKFPEISDQKNKNLLQIITNNTTIAIHIRRGDYLKDSLLGKVCDLSYYEKGISHFNQKFDSPLFIIFSDDITWCKEVFKDIKAVYVDWNTGKDSYRDMHMMSLCDHNIIANSSFSWWASWLNNNPNKTIISPKKWIQSTNKHIPEIGLIQDNFIKL